MSDVKPAKEPLTPVADAAVAEARLVADVLKVATKPGADDRDLERIRGALENLPPGDMLRVSDRLAKGLERHAKRADDYDLLDRVLPYLPGQSPLERKVLEEEARPIVTPKQETAPMTVKPTSTTSTSAPETATPTPPPPLPATIAELVAEMANQAKGNVKAEKHIAALAEDMKRRPEIENDAKFQKRIANSVEAFESKGTPIPMTQELRDLVAPKVSVNAAPPTSTPSGQNGTAETQAPTRQTTQQAPAGQTGQTTTQPQSQNRAAAAIGSAMAQIYAALRPPQPTNPPPWEQAQHPLGDTLERYQRRMSENVTANQVQAAQGAGEQAQNALAKLGSGPGGAILNKIKEAAQNEPGGMPAVVAEMSPGGKFADLRTAFNAALVQERAFASAYDRAVSGIGAYGEARMKLSDTYGSRQMDVSAINSQFEGMDKAIGQASETLPGRKDGKSVQEEIAEKAQKVAEFLKDMMQRIGNAIRPSQAPAEVASPKPAASPSMAPAMAP